MSKETLVVFVSEKYDFSPIIIYTFSRWARWNIEIHVPEPTIIHLLLYKISQDCPSSKLLNFHDIMLYSTYSVKKDNGPISHEGILNDKNTIYFILFCFPLSVHFMLLSLSQIQEKTRILKRIVSVLSEPTFVKDRFQLGFYRIWVIWVVKYSWSNILQ